jgi:hypothetical protein
MEPLPGQSITPPLRGPVDSPNLACSESLSGHTAEAIDHLRSAVGASEKLRADAREDSDFDPIRDEPTFEALISE